MTHALIRAEAQGKQLSPTHALIQAEAQENHLSPLEAAKLTEALQAHALVRQGLNDGGYCYALMSFRKP
jgi:hypothetical protein